MAMAAKGSLFATALVLFLAGGAPIEAQEEVCWWSNTVGSKHGFVVAAIGRDCPEDGKPPGVTCVVCEPGSQGHNGCHYELMEGGTHAACDDGGGVLAALTEIQDAMEGGDITMVASALMRERGSVSAEFIPEGGRIDLILACDPNKPSWTIPVLPELRRALESELEQTEQGELMAVEPAS